MSQKMPPNVMWKWAMERYKVLLSLSASKTKPAISTEKKIRKWNFNQLSIVGEPQKLKPMYNVALLIERNRSVELVKTKDAPQILRDT